MGHNFQWAVAMGVKQSHTMKNLLAPKVNGALLMEILKYYSET
jgi:hypothetical protein